MNDSGPMTPLPRYESHKKVWALKIKSVDIDGAGALLSFEECPPFAPRHVSGEYVAKHSPRAGGYWVQYEDGYESWSPAEAFEAGYTRLT